ncbi:chromate transporter [Clostridium boliviensis]|uniref:Chromate transporter n=1 Tax=Clostridium boliviensis TaxID=318465 RepID=A0ABU4GKJ9_9CLOT|nr:chromate transporter [Clostridium boliviensis]MDW2796797.1 chromate transporter [Clostridium boliviensis]
MNKKKLCKIFLSTLYLSAFTFGGGYVIVSLLKKKFVDELHWIDQQEMLDLVAIAQSAPGAIAVNGAVVVGYKLAGIPGILCAVAGAVIPPFVLLTVISFFYNSFKENLLIQAMLNGMKAGVGAVILSVVYDMGSDVVKEKDPMLLFLMAASFIAAYFYHVNVIFIILAAALAGICKTIVRKFRRGARL